MNQNGHKHIMSKVVIFLGDNSTPEPQFPKANFHTFATTHGRDWFPLNVDFLSISITVFVSSRSNVLNSSH